MSSFKVNIFDKLPSNKRKYNSERCQSAKDNMINAMVEYKTEHDLVQLPVWKVFLNLRRYMNV